MHQSDNLLYDLQCYARLLGYAHWGSSPSFVRYTYIFKISRYKHAVYKSKLIRYLNFRAKSSWNFSVLSSKIQIFISLALLNLWSTSPQCVCTVCQIGTKTVSITKNDSGISWLEIVFLARFSLHYVPKYIQMSQNTCLKGNCETFKLPISANIKSRRNVPFHHRKWKIPKIFFHIREKYFQVPPEDTLLSEMEQKSKGLFFSFLMLDWTLFCPIPSSLNVWVF